jgi:hypothetical protein
MPSSPSAEPRKSRAFALSAGMWLFALALLFSLWLVRASAQDKSPPESKASHNDSIEVIWKTSNASRKTKVRLGHRRIEPQSILKLVLSSIRQF